MGRGPVERVVVVGQGYVGRPVAMRAVEVGVVGYDLDARRIKRLETGESPVEDVHATVLAAALASCRYRPASDPRAHVTNDLDKRVRRVELK